MAIDRQRIRKFKRIVQRFKEPVIILSHLDPDSIGSAVLLQEMIPGVLIFYCGGIKHVRDRNIFKLCHLEKVMRPIAEMPSEINEFILVDSSSVYDARFNGALRGFQPKIVIDHHEGDICDGKPKEERVVFRESIGAASTLVAELYFDLAPWSPSKLPATLAALGILTDTKLLTANVTERDLAAYSRLLEFVDAGFLGALYNYPRSRKHFEYLARAIDNMQIAGKRLVTGVGFLDPREEDEIASVADDLVRMEGIDLAIVWGILVKEGKVRISARNKDSAFLFNKFLHDCFGNNAGAKISLSGFGEGGALIDLPAEAKGKAAAKLIALVAEKIKKIIFTN